MAHLKNFYSSSLHSLVDLSALSIVLPRVRVPNTPSTLFSFIVKFVLYRYVCIVRRTKINRKEAEFGPFKIL